MSYLYFIKQFEYKLFRMLKQEGVCGKLRKLKRNGV